MVEIVLASVLGLLGIRSLAYWWRRRIHAENFGEHALYAVYVTGRVGIWFALAGFFVAYAAVDYDRQLFAWYLLLPIGLAAAQLLASFFLSRRFGADTRGRPDDRDVPPEG